MRREIEEEVYRQPPDFVRLCKLICADDCPRSDYCGWDNLEENPISIRLSGYFELWLNEDRHVRRTILLLAILWNKGVWETGYYQTELKKIAGVKNSKSMKRIIKELTVLGLLKREKRQTKRPRYRFTYRPRTSALKRIRNEYYREYSKDAIRLAGNETHRPVPKSQSEFLQLSRGVVVGKRPPEWFLGLFGDFLELFDHFFMSHLDRQISRASSRKLTPMAERGEKPDRILLSKRVYGGANAERAKEELRELSNSMERKIDDIVRKRYFLTYGQAKEWLDFCSETGFDSGRTSLFLFEFSELDPWRTKNINRPHGYKMEYDEWRRRRRRSVL